LMESLQAAGLASASVEIGHVGIVRELLKSAKLEQEQHAVLFDLLQRKAAAEMRAWVESNIRDAELASIFQHLPRLAGGCECLREARQVLAKAPPVIMQALEQMESL